MIKSLGSYLIIPKKEFPAFQKAYKLARTMTEIQIEEILEHRYHLQRYPTRRLRVIATDKCQVKTETS
jgi:hypothetical protein